TIVMFEIFQAFSCRKLDRPVGKEIFKNKYLNITAALAIILQIIIIYSPLNNLFDTKPLEITDLILVIVISSIGFIYLELYKKYIKRPH
ncbi:MAG: cation-translocating P-type ATPase C-terminal domain-containing protein, partial [Candidatus Aenigmarchaeota archaeon]|nr:cation-translocating P-type ATPase C-terminal domain-containing protein [Candidatus Aenigmarchaeota archaeon]